MVPNWIDPKQFTSPPRVLRIVGSEEHLWRPDLPMLPVIWHQREVPQGWGVRSVRLAQGGLAKQEFQEVPPSGPLANMDARETARALKGVYPALDEKDPARNLVTPLRVLQNGTGKALEGVNIVPARVDAAKGGDHALYNPSVGGRIRAGGQPAEARPGGHDPAVAVAAEGGARPSAPPKRLGSGDHRCMVAAGPRHLAIVQPSLRLAAS